MAEFEKLIDIDLQIQHQKEEIIQTQSFKLYLFEALYSIQEYYGLYKFIDIIFVIIEFIQLTSFFIITYILICIYIIILLSLFFHIMIKYTLVKSKILIEGIAMMLQLLIILNIPFLRTLSSVFSCENDVLEISKEIECKSVIHIVLIIISILFIK